MQNLAQEQLRLLAARLQRLRSGVQDAVASEVGKAVADGVAAVLSGVLRGPPRPPARYGRERWDNDDYEPACWVDASGRSVDDEEDNPRLAAALVFAASAGKWWLSRQRSPLSAAAMALGVGGAMLAGGPVVRTLLGVFWTVHRLVGTTEELNFDRLAEDDE